MRTRIPIEEGAEEPRRARLKRTSYRTTENTMSLQTVSLSSLEPGRGNPRKAMDRNRLEGLAASIRNDGLLQNLVVRPVKGKGKHYRVVSGERRYRALKLLQERGEVDGDYAVPVEIRDSLTKDDSLRIATVENLQRQNLTPLEETAALTKLIHKGVTLDDVAAQTGLSQSTIKRRLALNGLCEEVRAALALNIIGLSQAEALTLGTDDMQRTILEEIERGIAFSADDIKAALLDDRPTVASAIFPLEQYTGTITTDLFADDETSYFDNWEEFLRLQKEAVAQLVKHHEASAAWVEVTEDYRIPDWQGGVLINVSPTGRVDVREGLVRREIDRHTTEEIADNPVAPRKPKPAYSSVLCGYIAHHKTAAVQELLLACPRKAKEVAVVERLMQYQPHEALTALEKEAEPQSAYAVIDGQVRQFATKLGFVMDAEESLWAQFPPLDADELSLYEAVRGLSDHDLDQLETLLTALVFGQEFCQRLDTGDSLLNRVARDLCVDMRYHWHPDRSFLERRTRDQLVAIAVDCGYAESVGQVARYKKAELVNSLLWYFDAARAAAAPTPAQEKAREWLPDAMRFPAVDPDASAEAEDEASEAPWQDAA
jgi:ParB family transcriptional regulator, chromosome partitioning protein